MDTIRDMPSKWEYIRDRLVSEGDVVGAKMAQEINDVVKMCRYHLHTPSWVGDMTLGIVDNISIYRVIGSRLYCTACMEEEDMCKECEFNHKGGEVVYNRLSHHRREIEEYSRYGGRL